MDGVRVAGWVGLAAALLVGLGEYCLQYTPNGGIEDIENYLYFNDISLARLSTGHFVAVLSAPLYLVGYWHLAKNMEPAGKAWSQAFFLIGAYAFTIGTAWISQRFFLGATVHEIADGTDVTPLLELFSDHNEPFVNVLRVAMVLVSIIWVKQIITGRTNYPRWVAVFNPALLLAFVAALYFTGTAVGSYIFPVAMNVVHFVIFAISLFVMRRSHEI